MKQILVVLGVMLVFVSCKKDNVSYQSIGDPITANAAESVATMSKKYSKMRVGDTIQVKMIGEVDEVCQNKGCWMKVNLKDGQQVMVKFKDYGFFMPKDIQGKEVIINGKAYVNEVPVDEQRHYAEDAGKSEEEIAAITEPKMTYSFEADGVLLKQL